MHLNHLHFLNKERTMCLQRVLVHECEWLFFGTFSRLWERLYIFCNFECAHVRRYLSQQKCCIGFRYLKNATGDIVLWMLHIYKKKLKYKIISTKLLALNNKSMYIHFLKKNIKKTHTQGDSVQCLVSLYTN